MAEESYVEKRIADLNPGSDRKVCIVGVVASVSEDGNFTLDDGGSTINIVNDKKIGFLRPKSIVRVLASNFEGKLKADIVQDAGDMDPKLLDKVLELCSKAGI